MEYNGLTFRQFVLAVQRTRQELGLARVRAALDATHPTTDARRNACRRYNDRLMVRLFTELFNKYDPDNGSNELMLIPTLTDEEAADLRNNNYYDGQGNDWVVDTVNTVLALSKKHKVTSDGGI